VATRRGAYERWQTGRHLLGKAYESWQTDRHLLGKAYESWQTDRHLLRKAYESWQTDRHLLGKAYQLRKVGGVADGVGDGVVDLVVGVVDAGVCHVECRPAGCDQYGPVWQRGSGRVPSLGTAQSERHGASAARTRWGLRRTRPCLSSRLGRFAGHRTAGPGEWVPGGQRPTAGAWGELAGLTLDPKSCSANS
jgi:hypothetical protein